MIIYAWRFGLAIVLILTVCISFWVGSRYPALNEKAMMASHASVADTISMWPVLKVQESDPMWKKIAYTSVNWANDNKKGMSFGVVLGGLFLTLLSYIRIRQRSSLMLDTLYGFILGSPIGVCVNCAAPVFKGVLQSRRAELAFAMMLSSPTMNIVVLTMVFTLFPLYMGVIKVLFTLVTIFIGVPLISKLLSANHELRDFVNIDTHNELVGNNCETKVVEPFHTAFLGFLKDILRNVWFIIKRTVPLMAVAGFLGSVVSHLIPLDSMMNAQGFPVILLVAVVGTFLPVPIAFDIILTNALFTAGLSPQLTLILLCTLGIFSAYSFLIVWNSASKQWAMSIAGLAMALGVLLGVSGSTLHTKLYIEPNIDKYQAAAKIIGMTRNEGPISTHISPAKGLEVASIYEDDTILVTKILLPKDKVVSEKFEQLEGQSIGLDRGFIYGIRDYPDPFWIGRGTGAGDYNRDGWPDIAFGSDEGIMLYRNIGGTFQRDKLMHPDIVAMRVYAVAFVDFNNDGWLDLFFTSFMNGNFILINHQGKYDSAPLKVPNNKGILTISPSLADIDRDGWIDIFNGNMSLGIITGFKTYGSGRINSISWGLPGLKFEETIIDSKDGETMSSLLSDFNDDGAIDLYYANDFVVPDRLFQGQGTRQLSPWPLSSSGLSSPFFSMSVDTGDFNNDLRTDFVATGTIQTKEGLKENIDGLSFSEYGALKDDVSICDTIENESFRKSCILNLKTNHLIPFYTSKNLNIDDCKVMNDELSKQDCLLSVMWLIVTQNEYKADCEAKFSFDAEIKQVCQLLQVDRKPYDRSEFANEMPQVDTAHIFLGLGNHKFLPGNERKEIYDHPGGWTWHTKIFDMDNDGWQDIFNAEGAVRKGQFGFNVAMHNQQEKGFMQKQFSWNLDNNFQLFSFAVIDFDLDGDLDIIGNSSMGPVQVYENQLSSNNMVSLTFERSGLNRFLLGGRVYIKNDSGLKMRDIKMGGGYQSFDPTTVHFGLGKDDSIQEIILRTPEGKKMAWDLELPAGRYHLLIKN